MWHSNNILRGADGGPGHVWAVYQCATCGNAILGRGNRDADFANGHVERLYPALCEIDETVPERARKYLQQAHETLHAPDASVVMAASAVDAMLKDKDYTKGTLYVRIDKAVEDHLLTVEMGQWAHSVRLEANRPRHSDDDDPYVTQEEATQAVEFVRAIAEFLFVLPARVHRGLKKAIGTP